MARLLREVPDCWVSVSATTRSPREGEQEAVQYFFKSDEEFDALVKEDGLLEWATYAGHRYGTPKSAVLGLVKTISGEVAAHGVRVNAIAPGFIDTPMFRQATSADLPRQQKILGHTPMERYGDPMDVGWAAVYLSSPAASFITGVCLPVDGGCSIGF